MTKILLLGVTLAAALAMMACESKGVFTPFSTDTMNSKDLPKAASLAIGFDAPNGIFHEPRYDLTIKLGQDSTFKALELGFLMDGEFTSSSNDTVQYRASRKDGMTVRCDDLKLQDAVDHIVVTLRHSVETRLFKHTRQIDQVYSVQVSLYDERNRPLGEYADRVVERSDNALLGAPIAANASRLVSENPGTPSAVFQWIATRANQAADLKNQ